ncbi:hypothetical protein [Runella sp. SP2]|uniref:hypothetical protein n=1 Tax=Runella sp. SP2 TaxID=2268026 RepID=UPI000F084EF8|nr:hypothetical protein [Runella sp. SP2]AYQ35147.1 hypothetical protein DTQ70_24600 [Runella sp. SP2]
MSNSSIFVALLSISVGWAQSKKEVKKYDIVSTTETIVEVVDGKEVTRNNSYKKFDKDGNVIEEVKYDNYGKIEERIVRIFDKFDNKTQEITFDATNHQLKREVYKYNELGEKIEESEFNSKNQLVSRAVFVADRRGLKLEKKTYDGKGKLIQTKKYRYDD